MSQGEQRLDRVESSLTPKQAVILWMQEAHQFPSLDDYVKSLAGKPESAFPLWRLPEQVEGAARDAMKGQAKPVVEAAVRGAVRDVVFLFFLHQQLNRKAMEEQRAWILLLVVLAERLHGMIREEYLRATLQEVATRVDMETPNRRRRGLLRNLRALAKEHERKAGRLKEWQALAERFLAELYAFQQLVTLVSRRHFDGCQALFPDPAQGLSEVVHSAEQLVSVFNDTPGENAERACVVNLEAPRRRAGKDAARQASCIVDMAKAEALDFMGEKQASLALVERYLP